jgi:Fe-S cluster assembly ATP-binding protein
MLKIKNINAVSESDTLLEEINLEIKPGEIHAVLGPKHSGKSALAHSIMGHPSVQLTEGEIVWKRKKIQNLEPEQRTKLGLYVSFQYPPEFESVTNWQLAKEIFRSDEESDLLLKYQSCCEILDLGDEHGDKLPAGGSMTMSQAKRNELVHMILSNPELVILDEIDSGLTDTEILLIGSLIKDFLAENKKSCLLITNNKDLLSIVEPTHVHVMVGGKIKISGDTELYKRISEDGYPEFS